MVAQLAPGSATQRKVPPQMSTVKASAHVEKTVRAMATPSALDRTATQLPSSAQSASHLAALAHQVMNARVYASAMPSATVSVTPIAPKHRAKSHVRLSNPMPVAVHAKVTATALKTNA